MEIKILYVCIGVSIIVGLFLGFYIMLYNPSCERYHVDEVYRDIDGVNSEEWATEIAAACLNLAYNPGSQKVSNYNVKVIYNDLSYEWIVIFTPKELEKAGIEMVAVRRDFGAINVISEK